MSLKINKMINIHKTRFNMFEVIISLNDSTVENLSGVTDTRLVKVMESLNFVSQKRLEQVIAKAKFSARGESNNLSTFTDFRGQLEKDERNRPYWRIFVKSRITATPAVIKKYFLKSLFNSETEKFSIQVKVVENFETQRTYWYVPESKWSPGIIRKTLVDLRRLLDDDELKSLIEQGRLKLR